MDAVGYDAGRRAFAVQPGATLARVYRTLLSGWGVTIPAGGCPEVGAGGHIAGGGYGPLSRRYGSVVDHLWAWRWWWSTGTEPPARSWPPAHRTIHTGISGGRTPVVAVATSAWSPGTGCARRTPPALTRLACFRPRSLLAYVTVTGARTAPPPPQGLHVAYPLRHASTRLPIAQAPTFRRDSGSNSD